MAARQGLSAPSFAQAAAAYTEATGGSLSKASVARITEGFGEARAAQKAQEAERAMAVSQVGESPRARRVALEAPITGTGNVSSDGVMVLVRDEGWKEAKIAAFSAVEVLAPDSGKRRRAQREGQRADKPIVRLKAHSYCVGLWDAETFGKHQYAEGLRRGLERLKRLSSVNDGAPWIERITGENFGQAVQIVDWGHSVQRLWLVGNAVYGEGKPAAAAWVNARQDELWAGEVAQVVRSLDALQLHEGTYADEVKRTPGYFDHNRNRMRYADFRALGYPIGSGTVESGAKNVVQQRMKRPGRGWNRAHAQGMLAALADLHSERFAWAWQQVYHPAA